jgi:hypothetical protein
MERAALATMNEVGDSGHDIWLSVVPVVTGQLRDSWFQTIERRGEGRVVMLIFGARIRYAIYVELGTTRMRPRAPIRTVAGEIAPFVLPTFRRKLLAS